jgi:cob(I)alamin adenosyltransferase
MIYLNRLSDLLFILSRGDGSNERLWRPGRRAQEPAAK